MKISPNTPCPCHSGMKYKKCCRPLHQGRKPDSPMQLMRSRYSAYALHNPDYIMHSTHAESPHAQENQALWRTNLLEFCEATEFVGLEIIAEEFDDNSDEAWVTFKAILSQGGQDASFTERSLFKKVDERWQYISADQD